MPRDSQYYLDEIDDAEAAYRRFKKVCVFGILVFLFGCGLVVAGTVIGLMSHMANSAGIPLGTGLCGILFSATGIGIFGLNWAEFSQDIFKARSKAQREFRDHLNRSAMESKGSKNE